jgi:hypothetical protein
MDLPVDKLRPSGRGPLALGLREDRAYEGLTAKQLAYCEARVNMAMTVVDAYIHAYSPDTDNKTTLYSLAAKVEAAPRIQTKMRWMLREKQGDQGELPHIGKDFIITGIAALALNATKQSDQLRAYELLGKAVGLFKPEEKLVEQPKTVGDVDAQLRDRLKAALSPVIDIEPEDITPVSSDNITPGLASTRKRQPE